MIKIVTTSIITFLTSLFSSNFFSGKYHSFEEKFTAFGQTVVVWCQKDFNQNKRFGEALHLFDAISFILINFSIFFLCASY